MTSTTPSTAIDDCPFCAIAAATPASTSSSPIPSTPPAPAIERAQDESSSPAPQSTSPPIAYTVLSTLHVLAFLDHAPITRGHTLVVVRAHREKLTDVLVEEGAMLGRWLGAVSRAVVGAVKEGKPEDVKDREENGGEREGIEGEESEVGDWNVVQNNGRSIFVTLLSWLWKKMAYVLQRSSRIHVEGLASYRQQ